MLPVLSSLSHMNYGNVMSNPFTSCLYPLVHFRVRAHDLFALHLINQKGAIPSQKSFYSLAREECQGRELAIEDKMDVTLKYQGMHGRQ